MIKYTVEKHSGRNEKVETFSGIKFTLAGRAYTVSGRNKKLKSLDKDGYLTRLEREGKIWHIYARKRKR